MQDILDNRGVCFFAYNNDQIDYAELALLAAGYVKKYLGLPVCLITDDGTYNWMRESKDNELVDNYIDYVVITDDEMKPNTRRHNDSPWTEFSAQFNNSNKHKVFEYSPFEQTLLLDIDYIVKTDYLLTAFTNTGVVMFDQARDMNNDLPLAGEQYLYSAGVKMWWSTVVYFDKSDESKLFFDTWAHVAENYTFYQYLYNFPAKLFRTDYCVSIATHILNGMEDGTFIGKFETPLYNVNQKDDIAEVRSATDWIIIVNNVAENWKNIVTRQFNIDLHVMNKRALGRQYSKLMEFLNE